MGCGTEGGGRGKRRGGGDGCDAQFHPAKYLYKSGWGEARVVKVLEGGYGVCAKYWRRDLGGMRYLRKCSHNLSPLRQKDTKHVCPARMFSLVILFPCPSATGGRINGSGEYLVVVGLVCAKGRFPVRRQRFHCRDSKHEISRRRERGKRRILEKAERRRRGHGERVGRGNAR